MDHEQTRAEYRKSSVIAGIKFLHLCVSIGLFYAFWLLFRYGELFLVHDVGFRYNYLVVAAYAAMLVFFNRTYNAYLLGYSRIRECAFAEFLSQLFAAGIVYVAVSLAWNQWHSPLAFVGLLACQVLLDVAWAYEANGLYFRLYPVKRTLLVYRNALDRRRFGSISGKPIERLYRIVDELEYDGSFGQLRPLLDGYEAVFVAGINSRCRNGILKYCKEAGKPCLFLPHMGDVIMQEARHIQSFDTPVFYVGRSEVRPEFWLVKRAFDIVASLAGIVVLSPLLVATALAIRLYDHGPALYKQVRLTKGGKEFEIWKFRSMRVDAEKDGVARLSSGENDDRITPIGRFVRMCRLDELPQLFNILKGDMSIVGPRPERPQIAEQYYQTIPDFKLRLQVKAGLTGYAQVYGKYNTDPYEKLQFDLLYINNMSILTDLQLMFATVAILFERESTEGVAAGQVTAAVQSGEKVVAPSTSGS